MEVYDTLTEAVQQLSPDDKRRVYSVVGPDRNVAGSFSMHFVLAPSQAAAALAVIGPENVELVSQRERYNAALSVFTEKAKAAGAKELA